MVPEIANVLNITKKQSICKIKLEKGENVQNLRKTSCQVPHQPRVSWVVAGQPSCLKEFPIVSSNEDPESHGLWKANAGAQRVRGGPAEGDAQQYRSRAE